LFIISINRWYIRRLARAVEVLTIGACVTAGVILGAGLSHLMPDAMEAWEEYNTLIGTEDAYPMVPAVAAGVVMLLIWVCYFPHNQWDYLNQLALNLI
jgi:hypothetical protein